VRPLQDLFVLDFSTLLPGPMATLLLAEAGAEVVKIERPGRGEEMRSYEPRWGRDSINFALLNRGKKSVALDLKSEKDLAIAVGLAARADVLVEQFRPGVMDKLGLGHDALAKINPKLIYCSISGYGQTGPNRDRAGHDLNYIGDSGLLSLAMGPPDHPTIPPALIADLAGGAYPAVMNILLALESRHRTGLGCRLDIAMAENLFPLMYWAIGNGETAGQWPSNGGDLVTGGSPRYRLYATRDGRRVAAAPLEDKFWAAFCDLIDLQPALRDGSADPKRTADRIAEIIAGEDAEHWAQRFQSVDCCCSIVANLQDALQDSHFVARGVFGRRLTNEEGLTTAALPTPIAPLFRGPPERAETAPLLGAHNGEFRHGGAPPRAKAL